MKISRSYITLKDVLFYSYHGVAKQEQVVGNNYIINLRLAVDISKAAESDHVEDTVNYANVHQILLEEMAISSKLLEHVCGRIVNRLFHEFPLVDGIEITLAKKNPPMGADIEAAGVEMYCLRQ
ncbi:dihydroneopterin aldolase [Bacteroides sp. 519]|uniref:dihydroneopterin aldolase n=1 Tax=Bacteroides sp. 519 TaxID=2302937 RepID=UPI0013D2AFF8|nr:dihydroneopterin aldolase [Bacteroides sp. 519]NDV59281.1 dihydroneopterin aldolase [Bacteroides sp. 519]